MELDLTITEYDYLDAKRLHVLSRLKNRIKFCIVTVVLGVLWGMTASHYYKNDAVANEFLYPLVLTLLMIVLVFVFFPYHSRTQYRQLKILHAPMKLILDETSFRIESPNWRQKTDWKDYRRWIEGKKMFLVYPSASIFQIIPKRAFHSSADIDWLRNLLSEQIKK